MKKQQSSADFMDRAVKADKPFFVGGMQRVCTLSMILSNKGVTGISNYADGMVEHDRHVGELLKQV